jgi:hypothetical protein
MFMVCLSGELREMAEYSGFPRFFEGEMGADVDGEEEEDGAVS